MRAFPPSSRVLVIGASGWFGRTTLALFAGSDCQMHLVSSRPKQMVFDGERFHIREWDEEEIEKFSPEYILDYAFLTPKWIEVFGEDEYVRRNRDLNRRLLWATQLRSTRKVLTVSSGAALGNLSLESASYLYGSLKRELEHDLSAFARSSDKQVTITRAWSVSGGFVPNPRDYAFSDLALAGLHGDEIVVNAVREVYRRYCAIEDLLAVAAAAEETSHVAVVESGGDLVEIASLAKIIASHLGAKDIHLTNPNRSGQEADLYYSDGLAWEESCDRLGLPSLGLEQQVQNVVTALRLRGF